MIGNVIVYGQWESGTNLYINTEHSYQIIGMVSQQLLRPYLVSILTFVIEDSGGNREDVFM